MSDNELILISGLKRLAQLDAAGPSVELEAALRKRIKRPRFFYLPLLFEGFAAAAVVALALGLSHQAQPAQSGFVAVPFVEPIGPYERAQVVRVNISISALAKWGVPISTTGFDQRVEADVVLGEDGLARAVRFIK